MALHPWYDIRLRLALLEKHGIEFQDLISDICERAYPGAFMRVRPYGKQGDKKCDGIIQSTRQLLQVYAPEGLMKSATTKSKILEDFAGAADLWDEHFDEWVFIHNQASGLPPDVAQCLLELNGNKGKAVCHWSRTEISAIVEKLTTPDLATVLGPLPDFRNLSAVTLNDIRVVVTAVSQQPSVTALVSAVPSDKLEANSLSESVKALLKAGAQKSKNVEQLFQKWHDPELGDRVASAFRSRYLELKNSGIVGDDAFTVLWNFAGGGHYGSAEKELATLALVSFLFEQCDIFEAAVAKATA